MLLPKTNIEQKLSSIKKKRILAEDIDLKQVYSILSNLDNELGRIENNVIIGNGVANNKFNIDLLNSDKIYHTKEIKQICIDYRLRFLDTKYFKGTIPAEGLSKIKALEKNTILKLRVLKLLLHLSCLS